MNAAPTIKLVPVSKIVIGPERRHVNGVESLADSIRELGLINPITVRPDMTLIAGGRRLAAVKLLGDAEIKCIVSDLNGLQAELAQIDENLIREELTVLEQSEQLRRRKEIYETLHPTAPVKQGRPRNGDTMSSFSEDTAKKTGKSQRSVQREVQIATAINEKAKKVIRDTPIADNKVELLKLARVAPAKQAAVATKIKSGEATTVVQAERAVARDEKRVELAAKAASAPPSKTEPSWQIITGDCIAELEKLKSGTARLIFADPPYNIGIDYGKGKDADLLPDQDFVAWCYRWIEECVRILTPDGSLWLLIGDEYADYIGVSLRDAGLTRRSWVKWYETFGVNCSNNFNRCSRHLFYCVKDDKRFVFNADPVSRPSDRQTKYGDKRADPGGKLWDNVWSIPRLVGTAAERIPDFPTQLPLGLVKPIVECASDPGDTVIDPFNGSGTTGAAAVMSGRKYIGIEKSEKFAELAGLRLKGLGQ